MIRTAAVLVALLAPIICGMFAVSLGKDVNWDLKNYHYYNAYAFLENRLDFDVAPAQLQTFYNPLLDLPFFWMTRNLSAKTIGFILGCIHGINLSLIFLIYCRITSYSRPAFKLAIGIAVVITSGIAPGFISELGSTMNDNLVTLFVLSAMLFLLVAYDRAEQKKPSRGIILYIVAGGFIMGAGVGLKPTISVYSLSSAAALIVLFTTWQARARYFLCYSIAGILGAALTAGFWWWKLWTLYANPLLPYFNNIFRSPYVPGSLFADARFIPRCLWEYFVWPVVFSWNPQRVAELGFSDIRFAIVFILFLAWGIHGLSKTEKRHQHFHPPAVRFLTLFFASSFILWMTVSSIYRYLITLELFVPIIFLALLERIVSSDPMRTAIVILVTAVAGLQFRPLDWGRASWNDPYVRIKTSANVIRTDNAVVVMLGDAPMAYVIPHFPATTRFVRPEGNLALRSETLFYQKIKNIVDRQKTTGKIFILFREADPSVNLEATSTRWGLDFRQLSECSFLEFLQTDRLTLCRVRSP